MEREHIEINKQVIVRTDKGELRVGRVRDIWDWDLGLFMVEIKGKLWRVKLSNLLDPETYVEEMLGAEAA